MLQNIRAYLTTLIRAVHYKLVLVVIFRTLYKASHFSYAFLFI